MTPEERARADAINASISEMISGKKSPRDTTKAPLDETHRSSYYTAFFIIIAVALVIAGLLTWQMMPQNAPEAAAPTLTPITIPVIQVERHIDPPSPPVAISPPPAPINQPQVVVIEVPQPLRIEYNSYHPQAAPKPASNASATEEMSDEDKAHARAGRQWAIDYVAYKYRLGDARPVVSSVRGNYTSSTAYGGWGRHTVKGYVTFDYYDMGGARQTVTKSYTAITQPADNGEIRVTDLTVE